MGHHQEHSLEQDLALAKEWSRPEFLPPGHQPGEGNGWRHTCYRLAKYIEDHIQTTEVPSKNHGSQIGIDLANPKSESKTVVTLIGGVVLEISELQEAMFEAMKIIECVGTVGASEKYPQAKQWMQNYFPNYDS